MIGEKTKTVHDTAGELLDKLIELSASRDLCARRAEDSDVRVVP